MRILVINCGSSSLKYTLYRGDQEQARGLIEKIGEPSSRFTRTSLGAPRPEQMPVVTDHAQAIELMMQALRDDRVIAGAQEIEAVGHRVVHGGPQFTDAALVNAAVRANHVAMELAPLHQVNYEGIETCVRLLPGIPQVAVFDTAFHHTMPPKAYVYALPYRCLSEHQIRRYGFHGTSHKYVAQRAAQLLRRPAARLNLITLHLGNGSSLAAIRGGRCVDTSMGLTPLAGVVMGSRCGDIDPAIVPYWMEKENLTPAQVDRIMNKESGLLGLSGISNDLREIIRQAEAGHARARLALEVFLYSIQKYIGAYTAVLGRVDALVFTAGIGEKSPWVRQRICAGLAGLGVRLDLGQNRRCVAREGAIHRAGSRVKVWVVPTREEYMIARETERVVRAQAGKKPSKRIDKARSVS